MTLSPSILYRYSFRAGEKSSAGRRDPNSNRCASALRYDRRFFVPAMRYSGWLWARFDLASYLFGYSCHIGSRHQSCRMGRGDSGQIGGANMAFSYLSQGRITSERAIAHRAISKAELPFRLALPCGSLIS